MATLWALSRNDLKQLLDLLGAAAAFERQIAESSDLKQKRRAEHRLQVCEMFQWQIEGLLEPPPPKQQKETVGLNRGMAGGAKRSTSGTFTGPLDTRSTLKNAGIDKNLSDDFFRKLSRRLER
jgi:hypothetical protein